MILQIKDELGNWVSIPAIQGAQGKDGAAGADGYTPVKGTDYWTAADKEEMVADVLAALPKAEEGEY